MAALKKATFAKTDSIKRKLNNGAAEGTSPSARTSEPTYSGPGKIDSSAWDRAANRISPTTGASPQKKTTPVAAPAKKQSGLPMDNVGRKNTANSRLLQDIQKREPRDTGNTPFFADRVANTVKGGAKSSAAAYTNVGGVLAEGAGYLNTRIANQNAGAALQSDHDAVKQYEKMLRDVKWADGKPMTAVDVQQVQKYLSAAKRRIAAHEGYTKAVEQSDKEVADKAYRKADELAGSAQADLERAKEGAGFLGNMLVDAGASMTQTGLDAIPSILTGGALGMAPFAVRAFGGATQQARQDGADYKGQLLYGTASAAKEVFTEKMFNIALPFAKAYGGGALDDVVERGIRSAVDKFAKTEAGKKALGSALTFGAGAVGEGLEEFIGDWMEWQLPRIYGGDVATAQETLSDSLYDFLVGATSGAMGGIVSPNTYRYDLGTAQQGVQERTDVQEGTRTTPAQMDAQVPQESAQRAIQEAVQRQTVSNPVSMEEQVLRQREAAVQKTFTGIADKLGDSGRKTFQTAYQGTDRVNYTGEFLRAYHAGMTNQKNPNSTSAVSFAAYAAGQNDAAASLAREKRAAQFAKTAGTDSGLVFDDYVSREMDSAVADEVNTVSKALGVRTRMVDQVLGGSANGQITGSDVLIAKDAVDPALQVVGHEWTHRVQELAPEQYRSFRDAVASIPDVQEAANILLDQYNRAGVETNYEQALDEATANYAGEMIANSDVLDDFIQKHSADRTLLQKLRDAIHEIVGKLTGRAKRQAQTVEGKLQEAFEAASKQAESLQNRQTDGTIQETRYAVKEGMDDGRENEIGGRTDTGSRKEYGQSLDRERKNQTGRVRGEFSASAGRYGGVNPSFGAKPVRTWAEGNTVEPGKGSVAYEEQQAAVNYNVPSFVVADAAWAKNKGNTPAFSSGGQIFFRETLPEQNRGMITPHEVTHVMKQVGYKPYLDFVERTPEMLNMSDPVTRILLDHVAKHQRTTMENADPLRLYDEFNATIYGHIATGQTEMFTDGIGIHVFHDFAAYAKELNELHERFKSDNTKKAKEKTRFSLKTDSQGRELTEQQREYFKDSKAVDSNGRLLTMYHQTDGAFTVFDPKHEGAGTRDNGTPFGIFLKTSKRDIGLRGKNQMELYVNLKNPLQVQNRDELTSTLRKMSPEYDRILQEHKALDTEYKKKTNDAITELKDFMISWRAEHKGEDSRKLYDIPEFNKLFDAEDVIAEEWTSKADALSTKAKEVLTNALRDAGYDGVILHNDVGSFGRSTDAYIALDPEQVKNVSNQNPTSDPDIRRSLKGTENAQEIAALKRENESLKERVEYWKGQTRRSQGVTTDRKSVQKAADALVKDYGAEISGSEIVGDLQSLYDYIASGKDGRDELTYAEARRRSDAIAERIAESAVEVDDRAYKEYAGLRKYLKDTNLTLTEADAAEITDFSESRKSLFGKLKISKGEHTNVDQIYSELSSQYPEFFNEAQDTNISDQVQRIADVANRLYKVTEYNPFEGYMGQAVASISNDIMDRFFDLPQTKKTFADRAAEQVQDARFQGRQAANDAFLAGQMAQGKQDAKRLRSTAQALAKERTRRAEQVQALKERYREKDVTRRDNQKRRELRAKIVRHASALSQKLLRPTDNQHIPEDMRSAVAKILESINQESSTNARSFTLDPVTKERIYKEPGTPTNRTVAFQNLKEQYQKIAQDGDMVVDPSLLGGDDVAGGFSEVIKMGDTRLADLTTEQLKTMWNVLKSVEHSVTTAGKTLASEKFETTKQFADALRMDGMTRRRKLGNNVAISLETPYTFFAHFGQTGKDIYRMLRNAQDHQEIMARDVAEKVHQILGDAKTGIRENAVTSMNEEVHHFTTTESHELDLTTAQAMELYLLSERKQAEDHLLKGGIVQPEIKIPGKTKIPRGTDVIHLSAEDIQSIVKVLTPEQIRIADGLQKLTTGVLANYGNEASMKAYGYKKFTEQDYWPIKSAKEALHSSQEKDSGNVRSIKNIGMAQAVKPNAATPLSIRGVFDTFADHASDMIDYAAWLCPMEDANRLYNFQFRDSEGNLIQTVKGFLEEKGGQGSQQYWQKLMGDIQNGIKTKDFEPLSNLAAKPIGWFKAAAVGANVRVVIQQPTAFFRASAVLDPADMARGLTGGVTKGSGWEKALTHSPIAMRKDVGSFDISSPYTLNDRFYGKEGIANKINDKAGAPAGKADAVTWGVLWNACEWQVKRERPNLRAGSGEFYSAVNEVFTSMIDQTQVVDGILQRSNIMRGKSDLAKQATSFMGEPIMSLNVFMRAWDNMRYEENPTKRSKAIKTVGRAAAALLVTDVVNALAQSIADAGRDDDPDKDYWEKFLTALTGITGDEKTTKELLQHIVLEGNFGSNINKLGSIPFVKDILSLTQGYSVSRTDMQVFSDIVSASKDFTASMGGSGKKTREEALANMFAACSKLFGLPVANIKRDAMAAVRTAVQATGSVALEYEFEKFTYNIYSTANKSRYLNLAFKALEQGDLTTYEHIRKELKDFMALDNSSVDSSMRSKLDKERENDEDFRLPDAAASLIGAKDRYGTGEGEDKFTENDLSSDDYIVYSRRKSELYSSMESGLEDSQVFRAFTDEQKDKALSSAETYAKKTALHETDKTYEITDKWVLNAQEAQQKYNISPWVYVALKTQVSGLESMKDRNGDTIPNSKSLLIMQAIYKTKGLHEYQKKALFEYMGVGKSIWHLNQSAVDEAIVRNEKKAGK
jgi:uncharacterized protein YjbJ (UPF0337 family)